MRQDALLYQPQMHHHIQQSQHPMQQPNSRLGFHAQSHTQVTYAHPPHGTSQGSNVTFSGNNAALATSSMSIGAGRLSSPPGGMSFEWSDAGNPFTTYDNLQGSALSGYQTVGSAGINTVHGSNADTFVGTGNAPGASHNFHVNGIVSGADAAVTVNSNVFSPRHSQHIMQGQHSRFVQNQSQTTISPVTTHGPIQSLQQTVPEMIRSPSNMHVQHYLPSYTTRSAHLAPAHPSQQQPHHGSIGTQMNQGLGSNVNSLHLDAGQPYQESHEQDNASSHFLDHHRMHQTQHTRGHLQKQSQQQQLSAVLHRHDAESPHQQMTMHRSLQEASHLNPSPHSQSLRQSPHEQQQHIEQAHSGQPSQQTAEQTVPGPESQFWSTVISPSARAAAAAVGVNSGHVGGQGIPVGSSSQSAAVLMATSNEAVVASSPVSPVFGGIGSAVMVGSSHGNAKYGHSGQSGMMDEHTDHSGMCHIATAPAPHENGSNTFVGTSSSNVAKQHFPCDICGRKFGQKGSLGRHRRAVHEGVRNFPCSICGYRFSQRYDLQKHVMSVHHRQRPFPCEVEGCKAAFARRAKLRKHVSTVHDKRRDYVCDICNFAFGEKSNRNKHIRAVHQGVRAYPCHLCDATFKERGHRTKHLTTQHGVPSAVPVSASSPHSSSSSRQPILQHGHTSVVQSHQPLQPPLQSLAMMGSARVR